MNLIHIMKLMFLSCLYICHWFSVDEITKGKILSLLKYSEVTANLGRKEKKTKLGLFFFLLGIHQI